MYYRRKLILSLLKALGRSVSKIDLQKLLFLISRQQENPSYEFVPYKYGCYSFQVDADKRTLTKYGYLRKIEQWQLDKRRNEAGAVSTQDLQLIENVLSEYGHLTGNELISAVYRQYPYFAINSEIAENLLDKADLSKVTKAKPKTSTRRLLTIGYEGRPFELYLNKLILENVHVLIDVRKNPLSMKFGFSKNQLISATRGLGIKYVHLPELGIDSSLRKSLNNASDYAKLFDIYREKTLPAQSKALETILQLLEHGSVALTCFEESHEMCHRGCVSEAVSLLDEFNYEVAHL